MLRITEIYKSIQGEARYAGLPCTFIRLTGCPLRCRWCDTAYGFEGGEDYNLQHILDKVEELGVHHVELTGGEPLAQAAALPLMEALIKHGYQVMIETGGSYPIKHIPAAVHVILDAKCPGSGMQEKNLTANYAFLKPTDEVKFVIASRKDFDWAETYIREHHLETKCHLLVSPAWGLVKPAELTEWTLASELPLKLNLQLHKYIWNPRAKGV
ncbi:MAG: radical SAM protein [Zetaproteobacteria bacterium]|nr:radical SAM protein [Zetaproteobacteria bacterium]